MIRTPALYTVAAVAVLAACSESPTSVTEEMPASGEIVITQGAPTPARSGEWLKPSLSDAAAEANLGGSSTTPLSLTPQTCSETASQAVTVTYTITGRQANLASFKVNTRWEFNGTIWVGSVPTTVSVPVRAATDPATVRTVGLTVINGSTQEASTSTLLITPFDVTTSAPAALGVEDADVVIYVAFAPCAVTNTEPTLVLPADMTVEATTSAGAAVTFLVTATDAEDGDLTSAVVCAPESGTTFALGTTTVNCSVTDTGGLEATGSFVVTVVDTTPAFFTSFPSTTVNLIAADINGAVLDTDALGITVQDVGNVSEPSTFACDYIAGTVFGIGSTTEVACTAQDAIGNESEPSTFEVFVGLNVSGQGFLTPLRMAAPFSAHKRGSTIPHKFLPPAYADGTPATDLAADLRLVIQRLDGLPGADEILVNDYSTGSTEWRYDDTHYIFNLKTGTTTPWDIGTWATTVSYKGIVLASTQFDLRR